METDRLGVFRAVARAGGFSRAAEKLHRTQPAVSQSIRALEEEMGEQLFVRDGRRTELTPAGRIWLAYVEEAFSSLERGRAALAAERALLTGEVVVAASDTTACYLLPPVLAEFRARHPGVELRLTNSPSAESARRVAARTADVGLVMLPVPEEGLVCAPLARLEDVAIMAPSHALASRQRCRLDKLVDHPLLLLDRSAELRRFVEARAGEIDARVQIAMELASVEVIKRLVALDLGVSVVPRVSVDAEIERGELVARSLFAEKRWRRLALVWSSRGPVHPAADAFMRLVRETLPGQARAPRPRTPRSRRARRSR